MVLSKAGVKAASVDLLGLPQADSLSKDETQEGGGEGSVKIQEADSQ